MSDRIESHWLYTSPAMFVLLRAALHSPMNRYFVLLSEACLPLYPAAAVYLQIIHEPRSRTDGALPCCDRFMACLIKAYSKGGWLQPRQPDIAACSTAAGCEGVPDFAERLLPRRMLGCAAA